MKDISPTQRPSRALSLTFRFVLGEIRLQNPVGVSFLVVKTFFQVIEDELTYDLLTFG